MPDTDNLGGNSWIILRNRARCRECNDTIESRNRHAFVTCECGAISVDGGREYLRRVGEMYDIEDLSLSIPSFSDMSVDTTLALIQDFRLWNEDFLMLECGANPDKATKARLAMYDRMFNEYGWIERIEDLAKNYIKLDESYNKLLQQ